MAWRGGGDFRHRTKTKPWYLRPSVIAAIGGAVLIFMMVSFRHEPALDTAHRPVYMSVDMHSHTTESDGDRTAEEQIDIAAQQGMRSIWITDHDMIRELPRTLELMRYGEKKGIQVSFGVEITVLWLKKEHHLLGYFPDKSWTQGRLSSQMVKLQEECAIVKGSREKRNQDLVAYLNELLPSSAGRIYFTSESAHQSYRPLVVREVGKWAQVNANLMEPTSLGRPHFRAYLLSIGVREELIFGPRAGSGEAIVNDDGVFFDDDRDGKEGTPAKALMHSAILDQRHIVFEPLPIVEAIQLIIAAGGRAVVAHPPTLGSSWYSKFADSFSDLAKAGLWGVEGFSSEISPENHLLIHELAQKHGLEMTAGSDSHGTLKVYAHLGDVHNHKTAEYEELSLWANLGTGLSDALREGL